MREETALYRALYQSILTQIYSGVIRRGQRFPSQRQICAQYNVGITTVRKAIRMLEEEGVIDAGPGRRATVRFDAHSEACARALARRADAIRSAYIALELLMPPFYAAALLRRRGGAQTPRGLTARWKEAPVEAYRSLTRCSVALTTPCRNPLLLDLQADLEHYVRIPSLPGPGLGEPLEATGAYLQSGIWEIETLAKEGGADRLTAGLERIYRAAGRGVERVLERLEQRYPLADGEQEVYRWFFGRARSPLYAAVARSLGRRMEAGEFRRQSYLPSVPQIMRAYGVSKSTAWNAVCLLSDTGLVVAVDKKGVRPRGEEPLPPVRLDGGVILEHLILFLDALQILAVSGGRLALAAAQGLPTAACGTIAAQWEGMWGEALPHQAVQLLLGFLKSHVPGACLKEILGQMDALLIWGYYLKRLPRDPRAPALEEELGRHFREAAALLRRGEAGAFAGQAQAVLRCAYRFARRQLAALVPDPARLPAALEGPQSPRATGAGRMGNK